MPAYLIDLNPTRRQERVFAWLLAAALAVAAAFTGPVWIAWTLRLGAAALFAGGAVLPRLVRWPQVVLLYALYGLVWLVERGFLKWVYPGKDPPALCSRLFRYTVRPRRPQSALL